MSSENDETAQLKNIADENKDGGPTYAKLSGHEKNLNYKNSEEYITFDFIVTLPSDILSATDNLKNGIKQSVDCELDQIRNLKITEIDDGSKNKTTRVKGEIYTDDWELPMLHKKFQKIVSDRVLSGNLQTICHLEDRPMIRRFWCKTSREQNKNKQNNMSNKNGGLGGLANLKTTSSLRTLKDDAMPTNPSKSPINKPKGKVNESVSISDVNKDDNIEDEEDNEPEDSPHSQSPLNDKKEGTNGGNNSSSSSGSKNSEGDKSNDTMMPPRTPDDHCECFCIVL